MKDRRTQFTIAGVSADSAEFNGQDEEIEFDLVDLWRILHKQKKLLLMVWAATVGLAILIGLLRTPHYETSATLQIGTLHKDDKGQWLPVESASNVVEKIKSAYIPTAMAEYKQKRQGQAVAYQIEANVPKGTDLVTVKTHCKTADEEVCKALINAVLAKIKTDHTARADLVLRSFRLKLAAAENQLEGLRQESGYALAKKQRLEKTAGLLATQLKNKEDFLIKVYKSREKIASGNAMGAMFALQIDDQIKKSQELIDSLQYRLNVGINQEFDDLDKAEKANALAQSNQANQISHIKAEMESLNVTREVAPVTMSDQAEGIALPLIFVISVFCGLFAGVIAALFREFLEKANNAGEPEVNHTISDISARVRTA
jgi:capsular polysaccharide biosynthesis protein